MSAPAAYLPCQCPKCRHRPVYGVCRCRICAGATPESIRQTQDAQRIQLAQVRAGQLLMTEDTRTLTDEEALELNQALAYLTRRN